LFGVAACVNPLSSPFELKVPIGNLFPNRANLPHLLRPSLSVIQHAGLSPESFLRNNPRREQQVRVVIALITSGIGRVHSQVYRHTVPGMQFLGELPHRHDPALWREFLRKSDHDLARNHSVDALLCGLRLVPQLGSGTLSGTDQLCVLYP
jgi:hypothetical protein